MAYRALILGTNPLAHALVRAICVRPNCGHHVIGMLSEAPAPPWPASGWPVLGGCRDLQRLIREYEPDEIIVAWSASRHALPVDALLEAQMQRRIRVERAAEFYERLTGKVVLEALTAGELLLAHDFQPRRLSVMLARALSLACASVGLAVGAPLMLAIALAIKLDSPGPVWFVQERCGHHGRKFRLLKFRSMRADIPAVSEWERDNDARITRVGRWLRRLRLDELPQFINVLLGEMNIVGPRPHPVSNHDLFVLVARNLPGQGEPIPCYSLRLSVRPGITGWAQVRYCYANGLNEEIEKLRYDLYYVKHHSLGLDLRILVETVRVVLLGHSLPSGTPAEGHAGTRRAPAAVPVPFELPRTGDDPRVIYVASRQLREPRPPGRS